MSQRLRVATLNCWNIATPFDERMALIRASIEAIQPDVIGLQEIIVRRDGFDQAARVLDGLGYRWVFGAAFRWNALHALLPFDHDGDAFGNVVAARWPIVEHTVHPLPGAETGERRSLLATRIETPSGTLAFLTTHFNWRFDHGYVRERQALAVAEFTRHWAGESTLPPVLVGDLNAEPDSTEVRFLSGLATLGGRSIYFQDAWRVAGAGPGLTWDNRNPFAALAFEPNRRIDYILVGLPNRIDGRGRIESVRLAFTEPAGTIFASDHFGVVADIRG